MLQSNAKSENRFRFREIRPHGGFQLRNPNPDFMDFLFTVRFRNPKKDLPNYFEIVNSFDNYALACEQALCLGKNSEEREGKGALFPLPTPLDYRPVHRLIMHARTRPLFLRTVFQILFGFPNRTVKTDISALKSVFGFRVRL